MVRPVIGMNGAYYVVDHLGMFQSQLNKQYILLQTHMPQCHIGPHTQQQSGEQHHCCTVYRAHVDDRQRRQPPNTKDTLCLLTLSPHFGPCLQISASAANSSHWQKSSPVTLIIQPLQSQSSAASPSHQQPSSTGMMTKASTRRQPEKVPRRRPGPPAD